MPGVNANKVEFIFNPLKYFSLGENFKINCKIDSTVQQHIVEVKVDNVSSKKTIEGLDVDIFPLEFVGEISAGKHSINVAIYEEDEVIGRMFYPCITIYDYNDYSIQYITDNNDKNPYISTYYIEPIVNINEEWEIEIFVDDFYCSGYRNLNIGDEKTYEIHVEIDDKHIVYDNLSHGNHFIKMPALSEYKVYDFVLYAKDNLGYESHVLLNEVWVKPEIEENIYQMTEDDLVTYGITNKKVENIVPIYCNEEEYNAIMAVAKNSRYLTRNEILSSKDEIVNYNIPSGEYVCFIPDFNNDGEYDPFEGWLYKEQYTRYAEDYNTEEIYNMAESNRIGLQQFIDDKIEEGYTTVKLIENGYFIVNNLVQLDSSNAEYYPGSIIIEGVNNFTLDLNGSTIKMNANANATSKIVTLSESFNSHVKNGIIDGDAFTHDYDNATANSEWNMIAGIHGNCKYCSFENLTMSRSSGYGYVGGGCHILRNGDRLYTSYIILCPKFVYGDIDDNGNVIESNDRSISDFIDISTAISKYKSFYGEDIKYIRGQISRYLGYQGNGLCNWNLKVFMYDENKNLIHKRVGYQYREVDIPVNTKYIRVVALADYNLFDVGTGIRLVHFFRPINCVTKNVTIKEIRGTGGAWTGSNNCLFTDMEFRSVGNHVTPTAFDFEDGWDQMQDVTMRNIRCFGDGGGSTNLMTCGGHNFIYENIGHDSEAVAYNYARTRHYVYRNCVSNNKFVQNYQSIIRTGTPRMYNCDIKTLSNNENPNIFMNFESDYIDRGTIYNSTVKNHIINNYSSIISACDIINSNVICNGWSGYIGRKAYFVNDRFICEDENKSIDIAINTGGNVIMYDCTFNSFTRFMNNTDLSLLYVENCSFPKGVAIEPNVIEKNFQKDIMFKKCNITIDSLEYDFINSKPYAYSAGPIKVTFEDCVITIKNIGPNKSIWYDNSKSTEGVIKFINCKFIFETEDKIGLFTTSASNKLGRTNLLVKMIKCEMIDDITKTTVKNTEGIKYFETNTDEIIIDTNLPRLVYLNNEDVIIPYCSVSSNDGVIETHGVIRSLTDEEFNNINIDNYNVDQGYINDSISSNALPLGEYQYEVYAVDSYGLRSEPLTMSLTINEYIEENDFTEIVVDIPTDNYELVLIGSSELIINTGEINWGDGTEDILTTDNLSHTYTTAGEYTIRGKFIFGKGIKPTNTIKNVLIKVNKLCSNYSLNLNNAFEGMNRLETFNCDNIRVNNLANTFNGCNALTSLDISNWYTSKVTNMSGMFKDCKLLTSLNLSNWDTSNVTDMSSMFHSCNALTSLDVSNWNTNNVTNMISMFRDCTNLISLDVSNWNTDNVTNMSYMFQYNYSLTTLDVSNWNTSEVTSMNNMFYACRALTTLDVSNWDTSNVTNMSYMFNDCRALTTLDVSNFNTSKVTNMSEMFHNCSSLTSLDLSNFNTSKVTTMYMMFYNCKLLTSLDVSKWDISKVTNMYDMFIHCTNLTSITMNNSDYNSVNKIIAQLPTRTSDSMGHLYIEGVDDHKLVNKSEARLKYWAIMTIFPNIKYYTLVNEAEEAFAYPIINSNESDLSDSSISVKPIENEGSDETVFCIEIETQEDINSIQFTNPECLLKMFILDTSNMTTMKDLFKNCTQLNSIECSDWDTSNVTTMGGMFGNCQSLTSLDLSNFDTSNVTDMSYMFRSCNKLTSLDLNNFITNNVADMSYMFANCESLTSLEISNWDTGNVTNMVNMFDLCSRLVSLDLSNWDVSKVQNMGAMFGTCSSLKELNVSNWKTDSLTKTDWMFNKCLNLQELDLSSWNVDNVNNMVYMLSDCESLKQLNLSNWNLNNVNITDIFSAYSYSGCSNLNNIIMNNSDYNSVNKIINQLPARTVDGPGTLNVAKIDDISQVDTATAESKFWNIDNKFLVAEYKFNSSIDTLFSEVNEGFVYTHTDIDNGDGTITRTIYSDQLPTIIRFEDCEGLLELLYLNTSELTTLRKSFKNCYNVTSINATDWDISKVTSLYETFEDCNNLITLDVSNWDTFNVTDMLGIFDNCHSLITLDVSNWDTSNVVDMNGVFRDCYSLTSLGDLSNWDTSNVVDMNGMFNDCNSLTSLDLSNFDTSKVTTMYRMFYDCYSLTSVDVSNWDTSKVTTMNGMFYACKSLTTLDLSCWDTPKVTDMQWMFGFYDETSNEAMALTSIAGLGNWDTTNVTNMYCMFCNCRNLTTLDISNWDVSNVTNMNSMFYNCNNLTTLDVSNWDTSNVTDMDDMFDSCTNLISITMNNSDYSSVNKVIAQLPTRTSDSTGALYIEGVDDHKLVNRSEAGLRHWVIMTVFPNIKYYTLVNEAEEAFAYPIFNSDESVLSNSSISIIPIENEGSDETVLCIEIEIQDDINSIQFVNPECLLKMLILDTSNMTTMKDLFKNCTQLNSIECSDWDTSNVTDMSYMFYKCQSLTQLDVSKWDTSNVTTMMCMFSNCHSLASLDVSKWVTSNVISMESMFSYDYMLTTLDVSNWNIGKVVDIFNIFGSCQSLTQLDVSNWDTSNVTNMSYMFYKCQSLTQLDVRKWDTSNVIYMFNTFCLCESLTSLDLSNWDTSNVTNMDSMFNNCKSLTSLDLSNFNTSNVTSMTYMFFNCESLTTLDVSNFDTKNVTNMAFMFYNCKSLTSLDVSNFNTTNVTNMEGIFAICDQLTTLDVSNFNTSNVTNMAGMFNNCQSLTSLDLSNFNTSNVTAMTSMFDSCTNLTSITMNNSDYNSVNKIIIELPARTTDSIGALNVAGIDDISQVDIATAKSKFWAINNPEKIKSIKINNKNINKIYKGLLKIKKIYLG